MDIPDAVYRKPKAKAALEGSTVKDTILQAVSRELNGSFPKTRIKLPLIRSKQKGRLNLTNAQACDLLFE